MSDLFATGRVVDVILALTAIEAIVLVAFRHWTGRGIAFGDLAPNLAAGCFLLLALRGALMNAWWGWVALSLFVALLAHLSDLWRRWPR